MPPAATSAGLLVIPAAQKREELEKSLWKDRRLSSTSIQSELDARLKKKASALGHITPHTDLFRPHFLFYFLSSIPFCPLLHFILFCFVSTSLSSIYISLGCFSHCHTNHFVFLYTFLPNCIGYPTTLQDCFSLFFVPCLLSSFLEAFLPTYLPTYLKKDVDFSVIYTTT